MWPQIHFSIPFFSSFPIEISLSTYLVWISFISSVTLYWAYRRALSCGYSTAVTLDIGLLVLIFGLIGGRTLHVLFENPEIYSKDPLQVFFIWQGGFVFYGGAILAFLGAVSYLRLAQEPLGPWLDFFAPLGAFAYGWGRLACFFTGCCYGKLTTLPWAIEGRHPTALYAFFWENLILLILLALESVRSWDRRRQWKAGQIFCFWIFFHALGRMYLEVLRDDWRGPLILGQSISFCISIVLCLVAAGIFIFRRTLR